MWICLLMDEESRKKMIELCEEENKDLKLSDRFLVFPLHISLKRSFYTDRFEEIRRDLDELMKDVKPVDLGKTELMKMKDMIWVRFEKEEELLDLHQKIDAFLSERYGIAIDTFDQHYVGHASLFRSDEKEKLDQIYERLKKKWPDREVKADRWFTGSRQVKNEYRSMIE